MGKTREDYEKKQKDQEKKEKRKNWATGIGILGSIGALIYTTIKNKKD